MGIRDLVQADPLFAAGAGSFSSGMEALAVDGLLETPQQVADVVQQTLTRRWNPFDRVFLARGWASNRHRLSEVDDLVEISTIGQAARRASKRAGLAMLGTWERLGDRDAAEYREAVLHGRAHGHLSVVQACIYRGQGLAQGSAESLSCWTLLSAMVSAALRLGLIGHRDGQRILLESGEAIEPLLEQPVDPEATPTAWTPMLDIAIERHEANSARLFAS